MAKALKIRAVTVFLSFVSLLLAASAGATGYTLTLYTQGSGTVSPNPTNSSYPSGVTVTLTATPNAGWYFSGWSGNASGTNNPINVTMNADLVVTGSFLAYPTYTLTLVTNGQGTITLNPTGGSYLSNTLVTATATPASGWLFNGWSGSANGTVNPLSLNLDANSSLTGTFVQLPAFDVEPQGITNLAGTTVTFTSHSVGKAPVYYQWFFNTGPLNGATNMNLSLTNAPQTDAGNYWVVATNLYGSTTSSVVALALTNSTGPTNIVSTVSDASLRSAIASGGWVSIQASGTFNLTNTINITQNTILDGSDVSAIISGGNAVRLFNVSPGVSFSVTNLTLANGSCLVTTGTAGTPADGGAIYNNGGTVALVSCVLTNNSAQSLILNGLARGGAIFNNGGSISLLNSMIVNNTAIGGTSSLGPTFSTGTAALGGAIFNTNGSLYLIGCNIYGNSSQNVGEFESAGQAMGGAIYQTLGTSVVINDIFFSNLAAGGNAYAGSPSPSGSPGFGGAVANNSGKFMVGSSQFLSNSVTGGAGGSHSPAGSAYGGAIYSAAQLSVKDSSFIGNQSDAGGNAYITFAVGSGGAIYNSGTATFDRSLIYSNEAQGATGGSPVPSGSVAGSGFGGGIFNASQFAATNCTIAFNSAIGGVYIDYGATGTGGTALGGGVFNNTSATFIALNLTIATNRCSSPAGGTGSTSGLAAGSQVANTNGTLRLHSSLLAYGGNNGNAYGVITDDGYNISSDGTANLYGGASYNFTDPQLGPLGNYGGPTLTMPLLASSPAIDNADSAHFPPTDQRGYVRPYGSGPDMGAYEYDSTQPANPWLNLYSLPGNLLVSFAAYPENSYRLQGSADLKTWTDVSTNAFAGATNVCQFISTQSSPVQFYRLKVQ